MGLFDKLFGPGWGGLPSAAPAQKLYAIDDFRAALTVNTLVHGPGASDLGEWRRGDNNSVVFACLMAISTAFVEAPLRVWRRGPSGQKDPLPDSPLQALIDMPNPFMDIKELLFWVAWSKHSDGNAYIRKVRSGNERTGNLVELWPISPLLCEPWTDPKSRDFITAYKYNYAPGKYEYIPIENMVHLKLGIDDRDHRRGLSSLKRLVRQISSDEEAAKFADALLHNFAVPGLVVLTDKDADIDKSQADQIKQQASSSFGNENRGNVAVLSGGSDVKQFGFSPKDLDLKVLHQIPETRICAVMRCPPAVAGVSVGLEQTSNYASFREVREMFVEGTILPEWTMDGWKLTHALRADFTSDKNVVLAFDTTDVRALQEDVNQLVARLNIGVQGG
jgi:HK97 family phage portal protein